MENLTDDEEGPENNGQSRPGLIKPRRQINELQTKLPFGGPNPPGERTHAQMVNPRGLEAQELAQVDERMRQGLKPSQANRSRALGGEQERIYQEILTKDKNF